MFREFDAEQERRRDERHQHVEEGRAPDRPDRLRPAARPVRPRVPRGTLRVTIDRPAGVEEASISRPSLSPRASSGANSTTTIPMGGHYTLEVTSPGLERSLRTPGHFQRSIGKTVALRLRDIVTPEGERSERRLQGVLVSADDQIRHDPAQRRRAHRAHRALRQDRPGEDSFCVGPSARNPASSRAPKDQGDPKVKDKQPADEQAGGA